ncbi:fimbria/pilus outer membrane usher protein [Orbus sturtevantii]|uniref:fimbria/pilus outer membrane usher protein n=1 Tax=Orbus sturtevantii TaxID=3074109 RepID=UPI00370D05E1
MLKLGKLKAKIFLYTLCAYFTSSVYAETEQNYEFNRGFLVGSSDNIDLSRFNRAPIDEGVYSVDVYTNDEWRGRYDLNIIRQKNGTLGVCYTAKMLTDFGINANELNNKLSADPSFCGELSQWNDNDNIKDILETSSLKLLISMPQIYVLSQSAGYVPSEFWDAGIPAINISYISNYYDSHYSDNSAQDTKSFYLNLDGGLSFNGWLLKHAGNVTWQNTSKFNWDSNQTYVQRSIAAIKSNFVLGQFYTESSLFDSIKLNGAKLATNNNMYPDGMSSYAPDINGVAMSNALVTVRQNGNIIYQTSVSPGPFSIKDISSIGFGGDLDVTVQEADGSENTFVVPYASISQLSRPGFTHYQVAAGKADMDNLRNKPNILQASIQHGLNNTFTLYSGTTLFDDYQAYLIGTGINTGIGALGFDVTYAKTSFDDVSKSGYNYRLSFNQQFTETNTNLVVSASHSSSQDYFDANEALYFIDDYKRGGTDNSLPRKNVLNLTINQNLPSGYGSFYLTGQIYNYWGDTNTRKQIQQTYNNRLGNLSYSLAFTRVYSNNNADNRLSIGFTYSLGSSQRRTTITSNALFNNSHFGSAQVGLSGALDKDSLATYGITSAVGTGGNQSIALNTNYRSSLSNVSANFSQGNHFRQFGAGANGSFIIHSGGVTFTPNTSDTMTLIEAKNAKGATIPGSLGTRIDSNGYAISSYVRPYRLNTIAIDPKGSSDDVVFDNTSLQVVPYEGTITKVKFDTKIEKTRVFNVVNIEGKPLTFGQNVVNENNESIGVVGQGGQVFIYDDKATDAIVEGLTGKCSFLLNDSNESEKVCL